MAKTTGKLDDDRFVDLPDEQPEGAWEHFELWNRVREALYLLPDAFEFGTELVGLPAADIPSANTLLGAGIEDHIPKALNKLKATWDPQGEYPDYMFRRQPQVFPDVPLRTERPGAEHPTLFAIEVKSWYVLARESEPSFRVTVNPKWCHSADLFVVFPWALEHAIAGRPRLFRPFVLSMRKAARLRNEYWVKRAGGDEKKAEIRAPVAEPHPWPSAGEAFNDVAADDGGGNFGRVARTGVMDSYMKVLFREEKIAGIPLSAWQQFLAGFETPKGMAAVRRHIASIQAEGIDGVPLPPEVGEIAAQLEKLSERLSSAPATAKTPKRTARKKGV